MSLLRKMEGLPIDFDPETFDAKMCRSDKQIIVMDPDLEWVLRTICIARNLGPGIRQVNISSDRVSLTQSIMSSLQAKGFAIVDSPDLNWWLIAW